jgi:hypothetical protein
VPFLRVKGEFSRSVVYATTNLMRHIFRRSFISLETPLRSESPFLFEFMCLFACIRGENE